MITIVTMPRNKNPNPRQVTEDYPAADEPQATEEAEEEVLTPEKDGGKLEEDNATSPHHVEENGDEEETPETIIKLSERSPVNFPDQQKNNFTNKLQSLTALSLVPFAEKELSNSLNASKTTKYGKGASWANSNSGPLEWAGKRFTLNPGSYVSASTIITMYMEEVASKQEFPVPLHNYQVGQILRRLFPNLARCKITRNRKRMWVYKDLCPKDLTQDEIEELANNTHQQQTTVPNDEASSKSPLLEERTDQTPTSSSPQSNEEDIEAAVNLQTRNEILRGLLNDSNYIRATSPSSIKSDKDENIKPKMMTSKDTEVQKWLFENYKYKEGFFVKSYDLLKRYNQGRVEMVKYLSQVGRVMKSVFPEVKHQRKSFYGGKREWVYLHLKPIDVESDSEEGRNMQLDYIRKLARSSQGAYRANRPDITDDWRQDRVNITHMPLSMVHYHSHSPSNGQSTNKPPSRTYFPSYKVKSVLGKKIVIKREDFDDEDEEVANNDVDSKESSSMDAAIKEEPQLFETKVNIEETRTRKAYMVDGASTRDDEEDGGQWASKRLKLCASDMSNNDKSQVLNLSTGSGSSVLYKHLSKPVKANEFEKTHKVGINKVSRLDNMINILHSGRTDNSSLQRGTSFLNDNKDEHATATQRVIDLTSSGDKTNQSSSRQSSPTMFSSRIDPNQKVSSTTKYFDLNDTTNFQNNSDYPKINGGFHSAQKTDSDSQLNWEFLQMYNPHQFGWIKCAQTSHKRFNGISKKNMFIEYLMVNGQWLVNGHRIIREVKIYSDWNVSIYVLGRRVYPDVLNGITDLEKSKSSLDKVFRVLSNAHICMGFHANSISDLYIHGILVSKSEVWSSREENEEEVRQRAVNCQILFNGSSNCCSKCERIHRLYNQQRASQRK